ncbi:hypothetical protein MKZ07_03795 [Paenibacillus sp. FSL P4-0338]|uniref:hypothetical protein n=1 Tax=unclassified Paenibacillus TaxID=185978 RepID=UPI0004AD4EF6|nr:hypothetical protein [Paenibacillus sp. FSL R7-269]
MDYNGDGNPDFTIGQYGSGHGSVFKLKQYINSLGKQVETTYRWDGSAFQEAAK